MDHRNNHRRRPSSDRFLPSFSPPSSTPATSDDFSEDDVFFSSSTAAATTTNSTTATTPKLPPPFRSQHSFKHSPSGILAALPDTTTAADAATTTAFNRKSPSKTISILPAYSPSHANSAAMASSAPMHVPVMPRRRGHQFDDDVDDDVDGDGDGDMLPPHEMVAKRLAETPILSTSVLEGAGRTLKGRDLRQVRNAVFRHTGFID